MRRIVLVISLNLLCGCGARNEPTPYDLADPSKFLAGTWEGRIEHFLWGGSTPVVLGDRPGAESRRKQEAQIHVWRLSDRARPS
jgi:hypothetical protein